MSVINQPFKNWECLIGIETCKDRTEEIIHEIIDGDDRFKIFTGPRSGSCSASRNTGIDMAQGEYVIFLDGDDSISEGALQRLHDKIEVHPGADLYPCAIQVFNENTGKNEELRDNYPLDSPPVMTGTEATLLISRNRKHPEPMMQLTICRRVFLINNNLKCIYGISGQDREFSPRALYLAKQVVPIHEPFYIYRKRLGSVMTTLSKERHLHDQAIIHRSLLAFHASMCQQQDFDCRLTACWAISWISWIFYMWFSPKQMDTVPREIRLKSLNMLFQDGFDNLNALLKNASRTRKIAIWWLIAFIRHPTLRLIAEYFFRFYYFLSNHK
jgi:glycosyltransferase involved in cell wall biosynthesis